MLTVDVALLFTDIEDSTPSWESDAPRMSRALERHDAFLSESVAEFDGTVVKHTGDGILASFADGAAAARAAVAAQMRIGSAGWDAGAEIRVRMGIHRGMAEPRVGDLFGPTVNRAARLMNAAHAGQILVSGAVAADVRDAGFELADLGEHRFKGLTEPLQVHHLMAPGLPGPEDFPSIASLTLRRVHLPATFDDLIGRDDDVAAVRALLAPGRVVTITGPGGQGKTRLAIEVARREAVTHADGAVMVELDRASANSVLALMSAPLGIELPVDNIGEIGAYLAGRRLLLVLDNCEHVAGAVVPLLRHLQANAATVTMLATSIRALGLPGERVFALPPLGVADGRAAELFRAHARAGGLDDAQNDVDAATVNAICARLDGNPLAIQLASARAVQLGTRQLLDHLDERLTLLGDRADPDPAAKHSSLRSTMKWSFDLLDADARQLLERLSLFVGSFDLDGAAAIGGIDVARAAALVSELVSCSLVGAHDDGTTRRFGLGETTRLFAGERLAQSGLLVETRRAHARHFDDLVRSARAGLRGPSPAPWRDQVSAQLADIETAVGHFVEGGEHTDALALVGALMPFEAIRWYAIAGWAERLLELPEAASDPMAVEVFVQAAVASMLRGDNDEAVDRCHRALALESESGRTVGGHAWSVLANVALTSGDFVTALDLIDRGVDAARGLDDPFDLANSLAGQAIMHFWSGSEEQALVAASESLGLAEDVGNETLLATASGALGTANLNLDPVLARELLVASLYWAETSGDHTQISTGLRSVSFLEQRLDNPRRSSAVALRALAHNDRVGDRTEFALSAHLLARSLERMERDDLVIALERLLLDYPTVGSTPAGARVAARARKRLGPVAAARAAKVAQGVAAVDLLAWLTGELELGADESVIA